MKIFTLFKWITTWAAIWTMLMSPLAAGRVAQKVTKQQLQTALNKVGLNKQMTVGQFYKQNEHLYPDRVKNMIQPFFEKFKNQPMPVFEVITSKTTTGEEVPVIRATQGSELLNVQWYGEPNRMFKFQNTNITEIDMINFDDMTERILASDAKYRKNMDPQVFKSTSQKPGKAVSKTRALKYPDITKAEWKSMSPYDRANYVVNLRLLWQEARQVLNNDQALKKDAKKGTKTSQNFFEKNSHFFALFFGQNVFAEGNQPGECIAAAYVTEYEDDGKTRKCSAKYIDKRYGGNPLYEQAKQACQAENNDFIACNPFVYGTPNGKPICITAKLDNKNFQNSTHFQGSCDSSSRLSNAHKMMKFLKNDTLEDKSRYNKDNFSLTEAERKEYLEKEQGPNHKLTEEYLLGLLKFRKNIKDDAKSLDDVMSEDILEIIKKDKEAFEKEIAQATTSCRNSTASPHEKNFWGACDQLHRRFLFVNELMQYKCGGKGLGYNSSTMKCSCTTTAGAASKSGQKSKGEVLPGASCSVATPVVVPVETKEATVLSKDETSADPIVAVAASKDETQADGKLTDAERTDGIDNIKDDDDDIAGAAGSKCGVGCKTWKYTKVAAPYLLMAAAVGTMVYLMSPKKPKRHHPGDNCPNQKPAPCAQICSWPTKQQATGLCSCDGCPPTQTADPLTCYCSTSMEVALGEKLYMCPDSTTQVEDLTTCPDYPCWNGLVYKNPTNCPTQQPTVPTGINVGE